MENFLDQYGKLIIAVVVIIALIAVAVIFRSNIGGIFKDVFNQFSDKALDGTGISATPMH